MCNLRWSFYRGEKAGVLGSKDYAAKEDIELLEYTDKIEIFTNGKELKVEDNLRREIKDREIPVNMKPISEVIGEEKLKEMILDEGDQTELEGLFVAEGVSGCVDFARNPGVPVEEETIDVNDDYSTGISKVYAAGDCTGGPRQIANAVGEGAKAALELIEDLRGINQNG